MDFLAFRNQTAQKNAALLDELNIKLPAAVIPAASPVKKASAKPRAPKLKAKAPSPPASAQALVDQREKAGLRSSSRVRDNLLGLAPKKEPRAPLMSDDEAEEDSHYSDGGRKIRTDKGWAPEKLGQRRYNPKRFGAIPGVKVGTRYGFRMEASTDSVHAPVVAGIAGGTEGCWSICVSGGYEGDVDLGERLTFSGSGGRDLKGVPGKEKNLRTAAQSSDQTWENPLNAALKKSIRTGKPIRVLRGFKGKSCYAPVEGYRYDGLYVAAKYWQDVSDKGLKICRVALVRLPGQPPIPVQPGREKEAGSSSPALDDTTTSASSASTSTSDDNSNSDTPATSPEPASKTTTKRKRSSLAEQTVETSSSTLKRRRSSRFQ
ncbi:hypothetical protein JCM11251_002219 [Rhodosporidiobolus azoricus]